MTNDKCQMINLHAKREAGFSLFEILVVMAVFVLLVLLTNQAFFAAFRSQNKSDITSIVKQDANFIISTMERALHSAQNVTSCTATNITYFDGDGKQQSFACTNGALTQSGAEISTEAVVVSNCNFSCPQEGGKKTVIINMTFDQAGTEGLRVEEKSTYQVQSRVRLHN